MLVELEVFAQVHPALDRGVSAQLELVELELTQ